MKTYSIEPATKKSIETIEVWYNTDLEVSVQITDVWRWGRWYITCDEETIEELRNTPDGVTTVLDDYDVELDFLDDGVGRWIESEEENEAVREEFERILDEDGYWGIEEAGWEFTEGETYVHGELLIEEVD